MTLPEKRSRPSANRTLLRPQRPRRAVAPRSHRQTRLGRNSTGARRVIFPVVRLRPVLRCDGRLERNRIETGRVQMRRRMVRPSCRSRVDGMGMMGVMRAILRLAAVLQVLLLLVVGMVMGMMMGRVVRMHHPPRITSAALRKMGSAIAVVATMILAIVIGGGGGSTHVLVRRRIAEGGGTRESRRRGL